MLAPGAKLSIVSVSPTNSSVTTIFVNVVFPVFDTVVGGCHGGKQRGYGNGSGGRGKKMG